MALMGVLEVVQHVLTAVNARQIVIRTRAAVLVVLVDLVVPVDPEVLAAVAVVTTRLITTDQVVLAGTLEPVDLLVLQAAKTLEPAVLAAKAVPVDLVVPAVLVVTGALTVPAVTVAAAVLKVTKVPQALMATQVTEARALKGLAVPEVAAALAVEALVLTSQIDLLSPSPITAALPVTNHEIHN